MKAYLEHINVSVSNLNKAVAFFQTAFPTFKVRGAGTGSYGAWLHLGDDDTYIALNEGAGDNNNPQYAGTGINHVGFVVEDVKSLANRLLNAGYKRSYPIQEQRFRIRDYFLDNDGNEYEFVEYLSDVPEERNDYSE